MDFVALLAAMSVAGAFGLLAGWLGWGRGLSALRSERDTLREECNRALVELHQSLGEAKQLEPLREDLRAARASGDQARSEASALRADRDARAEAYEAQLKQLREAREALSAQFSEVGAKLLSDAQRQFLERADQRFGQAREASEAQLKALLQPVESTLKRYDEKLGEIEKARVGSYAELNKAIADLTQSNAVVRSEAARLANVMRSSPKARGRWGEEQLRTILESAGLAQNVDFTLQGTVSDGERQLRPDCVITLPGGRCIVVDVKCPLVHFEQAFDEEDEDRRTALLLQHAGAMRSYAADLGRKGYWRQFDLSPDFVIMFIPGEHFLAAAAERAPELIETAFRNGVIVASTINMLALAKVMAGMWRQETLAEQAKEVADAGKELYRRLTTMGGHVAKLGRNLSLAAGAYNDFVGSLESQVLTQAKRFEALKVDTAGKAIEALPVIDVATRPLTKLAVTETPEHEAAE